MELLSLIVGLVGVVFLVLQASSCLFQADRPLSIGFVNLMLATLVLFALFSLYSGAMVIAPEFGVILLQGAWTIRLFRLVLILAAIIPGLVWHEVQKPNQWDSRSLLLLLAGALFGVWAAFRVHLINPLDADSLHVYAYDVWFPPLVGWLATCFSVITMAIVDLERKLAYVSFIAAVLTPLATFALHFADLPDPYSQSAWIIVERTSFGIAVLIIVYVMTEELSWKWRAPSLVGAAILGLLFGLRNLTDWLRTAIGALPLAFWLFGWFTTVFTTSPQETPNSETDRTRHLAAVSRPFSMHRIRGTLVALSLPLFFAGLVDFFSFSWAYRWLDVGALLFLWLFFADRLSQGALTWLPKLVEGGVLKFRPFSAIAGWVRKGASLIGRKIVSIGKFFWSGNKWVVTGKLLLLPIAYLILLAIGNELVNYRKVVIKEFSCTGCTGEGGAEGFASALVNELGQLRVDLLSDAIIAQRSSGKDQKNIQMLSAGMDSSTMESVAAKSEDLQISSLKIPMKVFVEPVQRLARGLLGIRTIEGAIRVYEGGSFVVFANSSTGDSWRVSTHEKNDSRGQGKSTQKSKAENPAPVEKAESSKKGESLEKGKSSEKAKPSETVKSTPKAEVAGGNDSSQDSEQCSPELPSDAAMTLVKELAFEIAKSDPSFKAVGFTSDPQALDYFREGLRHWRLFESSSAESQELRTATTCFQKAVERDLAFAPAQYRLGLAMQRLLRADAAIAAFKGAVEANPQFFSGKVLQAATLGSYSAYTSPVPAVLISRLETPSDKREEAFQLWTELAQLPPGSLSVSELRSTYLGICQYEFYANPTTTGATPLQKALKYYIPYFYCGRVRQLIRGLPSPQINDVHEETLEGNALYILGQTMELQKRSDHEYDRSQSKLRWTCQASWIHTDELDPPNGTPRKNAKFYVVGSRYSSAAVKYYEKSLKAIPGDPNVLCSLASAKFYLDPDDTRLMIELGRKAQVHFNLGATYEDEATNRQFILSSSAGDAKPEELDLISYYYKSALSEYEKAIGLERTYLEALNGYAYTFWEWRLAFLERNAAHDPTEDMGENAEQFARSEIRIARDLRRNDWLNVAKDTLADVLMAEGRFLEAVQEVKEALNQLSEHMPSGTNEIHWDAAQANLCAAANETDPSARQEENEEAFKQIRIIKSLEDRAEAQQFTASPGVLDPLRRGAVCATSPDKVTLPAELYRPRQPKTIGGPCGWFGVTGEVHGQSPEQALQLHVWGGGVNETLDLTPTSKASVVLSTPPGQEPSTLHSYYFARLESDGVPVSRTISFSCAKISFNAPCTRNGVNLIFDRVPVGSGPSGMQPTHVPR